MIVEADGAGLSTMERSVSDDPSETTVRPDVPAVTDTDAATGVSTVVTEVPDVAADPDEATVLPTVTVDVLDAVVKVVDAAPVAVVVAESDRHMLFEEQVQGAGFFAQFCRHVEDEET